MTALDGGGVGATRSTGTGFAVGRRRQGEVGGRGLGRGLGRCLGRGRGLGLGTWCATRARAGRSAPAPAHHRAPPALVTRPLRLPVSSGRPRDRVDGLFGLDGCGRSHTEATGSLPAGPGHRLGPVQRDAGGDLELAPRHTPQGPAHRVAHLCPRRTPHEHADRGLRGIRDGEVGKVAEAFTEGFEEWDQPVTSCGLQGCAPLLGRGDDQVDRPALDRDPAIVDRRGDQGEFIGPTPQFAKRF